MGGGRRRRGSRGCYHSGPQLVTRTPASRAFAILVLVIVRDTSRSSSGGVVIVFLGGSFRDDIEELEVAKQFGGAQVLVLVFVIWTARSTRSRRRRFRSRCVFQQGCRFAVGSIGIGSLPFLCGC